MKYYLTLLQSVDCRQIKTFKMWSYRRLVNLVILIWVLNYVHENGLYNMDCIKWTVHIKWTVEKE